MQIKQVKIFSMCTMQQKEKGNYTAVYSVCEAIELPEYQ